LPAFGCRRDAAAGPPFAPQIEQLATIPVRAAPPGRLEAREARVAAPLLFRFTRRPVSTRVDRRQPARARIPTGFQAAMHKKVLVYSHDTFGLGNIRRMLAISQSLVGAFPDLSVLVVTGSPMLHAFRVASGIDYVKLPCLRRTQTGGYATKSLELNLDETIRLRRNMISSAVRDFAPDLILVDKKPFGVENELEPALLEASRRRRPPRLALLLRDILDAPEATIPVWQKHGYHEAIERLYDHVLVVGSPDLFDLRAEYRFPRASAEKVRYCGFIGRERGRRTRAQVRQELGVGEGRLVLVTPGGGEDGQQIIASYLNGLREHPHGPNVTTLIISGPELPQAGREAAQAASAELPRVIHREFTDDMMSYMDAADVVVSMGGYNTVCEILTLRKRAVVVPRTRPVQEQLIRAERMARLGLMRVIHPARLGARQLMSVVREEMTRENVRSSRMYQVDLDGLERIRAMLGGLLGIGERAGAAPRYLQGAAS
jgi:predicted glycosyltransferase